MRKGNFIFISVLFFSVNTWGATINSIGFKVESGQSLLNIEMSGPAQLDSQYNSEDRQFILNIHSSKLSSLAKRTLNASSFDSPVKLVSPYQVSANQVRVVIQLKEDIKGKVESIGNSIKVSFGAAPEEDLVEEPLDEDYDFEDMEAVEDAPENQSEQFVASKKVEKPKDDMDQFLEARETKNFKGSAITLKVKDAEVQDVLRLIADTSGFNIVVGKGVTGKITLTLESVPWDQALDVVLQTLKLGAERNNNILRVLTLVNLTSEKRAEITAKEAIEDSAPRITKIFPISYADPVKMKKLLLAFGKGTSKQSKGTVEVDQRTNSIIVQDIADNIERMRKLVTILDTQTPQVLVEAKVVEATEGYSFDIGGSLATGSSSSSPRFAAAFQGGNPLDQLVGDVSSGSDFATASKNAGTFAVSPTFSFLSGNVTLNALLKLGEAENKVKVVSSPRTVVLNKQTANIVQSTPVLTKKKIQTEQGIFDTEEIAKANISLNVIPTVTNDEGILLSLKISRDIPIPLSAENQAVGNRNISTKVLVESGSTLVVGGIYTMDQTYTESGFPFLKDLPILGYFFGSKSNKTERSELFIFVTPTILNLKRAGLSG